VRSQRPKNFYFLKKNIPLNLHLSFSLVNYLTKTTVKVSDLVAYIYNYMYIYVLYLQNIFTCYTRRGLSRSDVHATAVHQIMGERVPVRRAGSIGLAIIALHGRPLLLEICFSGPGPLSSSRAAEKPAELTLDLIHILRPVWISTVLLLFEPVASSLSPCYHSARASMDSTVLFIIGVIGKHVCTYMED